MAGTSILQRLDPRGPCRASQSV